MLHLDEAGARGLAARLDGREFTVQGVEEKPYRRRPYAPFMTTTLQQEAGRKFRWSAQQVMRIAQRLYENGFITYMRTDSTTLSRDGADRGPDAGPRAVRRRLRARPSRASTTARSRTPRRRTRRSAPPATRSARRARSPTSSSRDEFRLYELIWQRTLASQMSDAVGTTVSVRIGGTSVAGEAVVFTTSGRTITFPGFLRAYVEDTDESAREATTPRSGCRS